MSQRNISSLPLPQSEYRVDDSDINPRAGDFETRTSAQNEDQHRANLLRRASVKHNAFLDARKASALADRLDQSGERGVFCETLASSSFMRHHRVRIIGALWKLVVEDARQKRTSFTVIPASWRFPSEELLNVDPQKLLNSFRTSLYRFESTKGDGWLLAFLHSEFDPQSNTYQFHVHGWAYGTMIHSIDKLRQVENYKSTRKTPAGQWSPVYQRVHVIRKPVTDLAYAISYTVQAFWPSRPIFINPEGRRRRVRSKMRIAEPFHSNVLLWFDRWQLADLALLVGLRVTRNGLTRTRLVQ